MTTIYASIGNSDDKLTQRQWADLVEEFFDGIAQAAEQIHGAWFSAPDSPFQNACCCFEIGGPSAAELKISLAETAHAYDQDSIAWAVAQTEFIKAAH